LFGSLARQQGPKGGSCDDGGSDNNAEFKAFKPKSERMSFEFRNLNLFLKNGKRKRILNNVSGLIDHSSMVAVMGTSGAGKSTFMNALCGRASSYAVTTGDVLINGQVANNRPVFPTVHFCVFRRSFLATATA
jgi:ABC-type multidrug transport system ATPase subunit